MWQHIISRRIQQGLKTTQHFAKNESNLTLLDNSIKHKSDCCVVAKCKSIRNCLPSLVHNFQHGSNPTAPKQGRHSKSNYNDHNTQNVDRHTIFEAFGWSGALVFGWVISKQFWLERKWRKVEEEPTRPKLHYPQESFIQFLVHIVKNQPPVSFVLPQVSLKNDFKTAETPEAQDEFIIAANKLKELHNKTMGEALNRRGIACLSKSSGVEAMKYFQQASDLKYPPASFNMGQCCELGIGTKQDFKEAAEWYKIASDQGHATAMYNLGVFYAHGWGGLQADIEVAKTFFRKAANLGQLDAKAALEKETKSRYASEENDLTGIKCGSTNIQCQKPENIFFVENIKHLIKEDVINRNSKPDENWNIQFSSTIAY